MNRLVTEADGLLKNGGFEYAFCGGQALDLFLGYESRVHGDIDVCAYWNSACCTNRQILNAQVTGRTLSWPAGKWSRPGGSGLRRALLRELPGGHPWLDALQAQQMTDNDGKAENA